MDWSRWPNFTEAEFRCNGSGLCEMDPAFMDRLQALRTTVGFPLPVTSGYRSPAYNAQVSSSGRDGPHTTGRAVDIAVDRERAYRVLREAPALGFTGIGIKQKGGGRFIHLDDLADHETNGPRPTVWSY